MPRKKIYAFRNLRESDREKLPVHKKKLCFMILVLYALYDVLYTVVLKV